MTNIVWHIFYHNKKKMEKKVRAENWLSLWFYPFPHTSLLLLATTPFQIFWNLEFTFISDHSLAPYPKNRSIDWTLSFVAHLFSMVPWGEGHHYSDESSSTWVRPQIPVPSPAPQSPDLVVESSVSVGPLLPYLLAFFYPIFSIWGQLENFQIHRHWCKSEHSLTT